MKAVQSQQGAEVYHIQEVIAAHQQQIKAFEERESKFNLMFSNVPETDVIVDSEVFKIDECKILNLANLILPHDNKICYKDLCKITCQGRDDRKPCILKHN